MKKTSSRARRKRSERHALTVAVGVVAGILLLTSGYLWLIGAGDLSPGAVGGSFSLVEDDGQPVTDRSFRGKYLLIYFGYTSCRDVCPTTLASMAAALDTLGDKARQVQPLFITVDPDRDTPEIMRRYVRSFMPQLIGLTGTAAELRRAANEYRIKSVIHAAGPVDHSSVIYLVGRDGHTIAPIRADESGDELARTIGKFIS